MTIQELNDFRRRVRHEATRQWHDATRWQDLNRLERDLTTLINAHYGNEGTPRTAGREGSERRQAA